nr:HalOD1 output domain-containing protein [Salinigranum rubrum]
MSREVLDRVAPTIGRAVTQLPPLYEAIDPDALVALVDSVETDTESPRPDLAILDSNALLIRTELLT